MTRVSRRAHLIPTREKYVYYHTIKQRIVVMWDDNSSQDQPPTQQMGMAGQGQQGYEQPSGNQQQYPPQGQMGMPQPYEQFPLQGHMGMQQPYQAHQQVPLQNQRPMGMPQPSDDDYFTHLLEMDNMGMHQPIAQITVPPVFPTAQAQVPVPADLAGSHPISMDEVNRIAAQNSFRPAPQVHQKSPVESIDLTKEDKTQVPVVAAEAQVPLTHDNEPQVFIEAVETPQTQQAELLPRKDSLAKTPVTDLSNDITPLNLETVNNIAVVPTKKAKRTTKRKATLGDTGVKKPRKPRTPKTPYNGPKRGRGRPRKQPLPEADQTQTPTQDQVPTPTTRSWVPEPELQAFLDSEHPGLEPDLCSEAYLDAIRIYYSQSYMCRDQMAEDYARALANEYRPAKSLLELAAEQGVEIGPESEGKYNPLLDAGARVREWQMYDLMAADAAAAQGIRHEDVFDFDAVFGVLE